jgi:hypothetical protein
MDGHHGALVKIDLQTELLQATGSSRLGTEDDQCIVRVLQHRTRHVVDQGVTQQRVLLDHLLEHIGDDEEQV